MRSRVVVVARAGPSGGTQLQRLEAHGALAVRRTGPHEVHVVGTAAGPVGDDEIDVTIDVGPGARLDLFGVAATIALPGRVPGRSQVRLDVTVAAGAVAMVTLPPLVVTSAADVRAETNVQVDGVLDLTERVQLGRHAEPGGSWAGRLTADVRGVPALRQTQRSALIVQAAGGTDGRAGLVTRVLLGPEITDPTHATLGHAFVVPLATGGVMWSAYGTDLATAAADLTTLAADAPQVVAKPLPSS